MKPASTPSASDAQSGRRERSVAVLVARLRVRQSVQEAEAAVAGRDPPPWVFPASTDDAKPVNAAFLRFKVWYRILTRACCL